MNVQCFPLRTARALLLNDDFDSVLGMRPVIYDTGIDFTLSELSIIVCTQTNLAVCADLSYEFRDVQRCNSLVNKLNSAIFVISLLIRPTLFTAKINAK